MKLFCWNNVQALKHWCGGRVIVLADNVEQAIRLAISKYQEDYISESHPDDDELIKEMLEEVVQKGVALLHELQSNSPEVYENEPAAFIMFGEG